MGRDVRNAFVCVHIANFNSHARVGRDYEKGLSNKRIFDNFNSHARVGRDSIAVI